MGRAAHDGLGGRTDALDPTVAAPRLHRRGAEDAETASENRMPGAASENSREFAARAAKPRESAADGALAPPRGPETIREFSANFRISGDFSAIKTNFREPGECTPCATLCTVMLHVSPCANGLFRDHRDSASLLAKTVSHCGRFGVVFGQKVTHECAMWRIADGQAPYRPGEYSPG